MDVLVTLPMVGDVQLLSGGASSVWSALESPRSLPELVDRVAGLHAVPVEEVWPEVQGCLDTLVALGLVEEVPGRG